MKIFSENQFSGKTHFCSIASRERAGDRVEVTELFREDNDVSRTRQWLKYSRE